MSNPWDSTSKKDLYERWKKLKTKHEALTQEHTRALALVQNAPETPPKNEALLHLVCALISASGMPLKVHPPALVAKAREYLRLLEPDE